MNQQRPPWQSEQANYQYPVPRNPPAPKALGNVQLYNPNQYTPSQQMPSNGAYMPQQQPAAGAPGQSSSGWDQNVNKYANYQQNHSVPGQNHQIAPPTQPSPMFNMPDYSLNHQIPNFAPDQVATNNNQLDPTANSSENWGWDDANDWGTSWSNENTQQPGQHETIQQQQQQQQQPSPPSLPPVQVEPSHFHPPPTTGLEHGLNAMSLVEQPTPMQYSAQVADVTVPWSQTPTGWGSTEEQTHNHGYSQELGERNTLADGASFTDHSQPPPQSSSMRQTPQLSGEAGSHQLYQPAGAESSLRASHPPPSTLALGEVRPLHISASPQSTASWILPTTEPILEAAASDGMVASTAEVFNGTAYNGCAETLEQVPPSNVEVAEVADVLPSIGVRLPASGSRSQSGTPSMERESERPDAEGGYENDQLTPLYSTQASGASLTFVAMNSDRKGAQESPVTSRPASRQAGSTPSAETPNSTQSPSYIMGGGGGSDSFVRPKPVPSAAGGATGTGGGPGFYTSPNTTSNPITNPTQSASPFHMTRGSQEAVGSEYGPPVSRSDNSMLPPSSQRMIPGSGSQGPPPMSTGLPSSSSQQQPQQQPLQQAQQQRPPASVTPVSEQRIVTGFAKNDPVPPPSLLTTTPQPAAAQVTGGSSSMGIPPAVEVEARSSLNRSPPSHRSETIGSENPRANTTTATPATMTSGGGGGGPSGGGVNAGDRSDERGSTGEQISRDRDHLIKPHDNRSRMDRDRDRGKWTTMTIELIW